MKKHVITAAVALAVSAGAFAEKEFCETGTTRCLIIPAGMKLIQVPWYWDLKKGHIVYLQKGAQLPGTPGPDAPEPCDDLVVGPDVCAG